MFMFSYACAYRGKSQRKLQKKEEYAYKCNQSKKLTLVMI